jgi:hypothetical protein
MSSTEDPRKRKIILLLAGIEPGSPSCESDVLPLDHGLPPVPIFSLLLSQLIIHMHLIQFVWFVNLCVYSFVQFISFIWLIICVYFLCICFFCLFDKYFTVVPSTWNQF